MTYILGMGSARNDQIWLKPNPKIPYLLLQGGQKVQHHAPNQ